MAHFRTRPRNKGKAKVLQFGSHVRKRRAGQRRDWWKKNWAYAALLTAPIIGVAVAWLWQIGPAETLPSSGSPSEQYEVSFSRCSGPVRVTCVVDGDTIWLRGQKIRIADINTPEIGSPDCPAERALGERATSRLVVLLNAGGFSLKPIDRDEDRFGRKLRIITRGGVSVGNTLVAEGLAERWTGSRRSWC